jgi:hypothetical protein
VRNGKPAKLVDRSMGARYVAGDVDENGEKGAGGVVLGEQAFLDLTDRQNDEVGFSLQDLALPSNRVVLPC